MMVSDVIKIWRGMGCDANSAFWMYVCPIAALLVNVKGRELDLFVCHNLSCPWGDISGPDIRFRIEFGV